ncbi:hypothetical protein HW555_013779 [Spodoptera exigua]|uniref:Uncharacterized protein n=1 Tax=Spodoptera exigua TaxID=7107 RepID=A0A835KWN1_SPOEX|nr:hypothetical protein HW555_013779 [Spodoptera exigua]
MCRFEYWSSEYPDSATIRSAPTKRAPTCVPVPTSVPVPTCVPVTTYVPHLPSLPSSASALYTYPPAAAELPDYPG